MSDIDTVQIRSHLTGEIEEIIKPLRAEHVKVGQLLWYHGFTSTSTWSCPAVIVEVDEEKRKFFIRSLDDMRQQSQAYDIEPNYTHIKWVRHTVVKLCD